MMSAVNNKILSFVCFSTLSILATRQVYAVSSTINDAAEILAQELPLTSQAAAIAIDPEIVQLLSNLAVQMTAAF